MEPKEHTQGVDVDIFRAEKQTKQSENPAGWVALFLTTFPHTLSYTCPRQGGGNVFHLTTKKPSINQH